MTHKSVKHVHVIIEATSEDYHGTYKEVIAVYHNKLHAKKRIKKLQENCNSYNTEYYFETYPVL